MMVCNPRNPAQFTFDGDLCRLSGIAEAIKSKLSRIARIDGGVK